MSGEWHTCSFWHGNIWIADAEGQAPFLPWLLLWGSWSDAVSMILSVLGVLNVAYSAQQCPDCPFWAFSALEIVRSCRDRGHQFPFSLLTKHIQIITNRGFPESCQRARTTLCFQAVLMGISISIFFDDKLSHLCFMMRWKVTNLLVNLLSSLW